VKLESLQTRHPLPPSPMHLTASNPWLGVFVVQGRLYWKRGHSPRRYGERRGKS